MGGHFETEQSPLIYKKMERVSKLYLKKICQHHCAAIVSIQSCTKHIKFQLPNENTRVGYLIDVIKNLDAQHQAAIANTKHNVVNGTSINPGKHNDFELTVAYLLPNDSVTRK